MHECVTFLCLFSHASHESAPPQDVMINISRDKSFPRQHLLSDLTVTLATIEDTPDIDYTTWTNKSDLVPNGQQYKYFHLLLYVILVMVSLFNIRFRNEFEVSDIWNGTDVKRGRVEQWKQMRRTEWQPAKERRGGGRVKVKRNRLLVTTLLLNGKTTWQLFLNKATNISGEVDLPVIQLRM